MKEECLFLFLFQPFKFKAYFPALSQLEKKLSCPTGIRGPGQAHVAFSWLCPTTVFWGKCRSVVVAEAHALTSSGASSHGRTDRCFCKKTCGPRFSVERR